MTLDAAALRKLLASSAPVPSVYGDDGAGRETATLIPAAVLVPIVDRAEGLTVLFTQRTEQLKSHSGQVSFPGGRTEPDDPSPEFTALREAQEEIGLARERVEVLTRLSDYLVRFASPRWWGC